MLHKSRYKIKKSNFHSTLTLYNTILCLLTVSTPGWTRCTSRGTSTGRGCWCWAWSPSPPSASSTPRSTWPSGQCHTHKCDVSHITRVTCQAAAEGAAAQGGPHVRGADADRGRVHGLQPAQAAAQHARDHRHTTSKQVDKILLQNNGPKPHPHYPMSLCPGATARSWAGSPCGASPWGRCLALSRVTCHVSRVTCPGSCPTCCSPSTPPPTS